MGITLAKGFGVDLPENLIADIDAVGVAAIGLGGAVLALWSRLWPSEKTLKARPGVLGTKIGGPMALMLAVILGG